MLLFTIKRMPVGTTSYQSKLTAESVPCDFQHGCSDVQDIRLWSTEMAYMTHSTSCDRSWGKDSKTGSSNESGEWKAFARKTSKFKFIKLTHQELATAFLQGPHEHNACRALGWSVCLLATWFCTLFHMSGSSSWLLSLWAAHQKRWLLAGWIQTSSTLNPAHFAWAASVFLMLVMNVKLEEYHIYNIAFFLIFKDKC